MSREEHFLSFKMLALCFVIYFGLWLLMMRAFNTWSLKLDETGDARYIGKMKVWAGFGLVAYVVSMTFAATHWGMSTDPTFFSTIYGAWMIAGYALAMMCFCVIVLTSLDDEGLLASKLSSRIYHLRQLHAGLHDLLVVPVLLALFDYLERQPAQSAGACTAATT